MASTDIESAETQIQQAEGPQDTDKIQESKQEEGATAGTSANKINQMEIESSPISFVGLGKEELLALANRPLWVRVRWALFITFWLMWLGLLVGAALIIAFSPGCEDYSEEDLKKASAAQHHR